MRESLLAILRGDIQRKINNNFFNFTQGFQMFYFTLFYLTFHNEFNYIAISPMELSKDLPNDFPKIPNEFFRGFA